MSEPAGPQWCARFPTSDRLEDLLPDFGDACRAFISILKKGGASVAIAATFRPPERAYLMHWCCMIGGGGQDPASVPPMTGVNIDLSFMVPATSIDRHTEKSRLSCSRQDALFH